MALKGEGPGLHGAAAVAVAMQWCLVGAGWAHAPCLLLSVLPRAGLTGALLCCLQ
jgi:hypothetical protein